MEGVTASDPWFPVQAQVPARTARLPQVAGRCTLAHMSTVAEIKAAIAQLTLEERAEVARCLHEWEDDAWDKQMQQDLAAGKLDGLLAKVDDDIDQGKLRDLP